MASSYQGGVALKINAKTDFIEITRGEIFGSDEIEAIAANLVAHAKAQKKHISAWVKDGKGDVTVKIATKSGGEFSAMGFKPATIEKLMATHSPRILVKFAGKSPMPYLAFFPKSPEKTATVKQISILGRIV